MNERNLIEFWHFVVIGIKLEQFNSVTMASLESLFWA
jgi:hypothetical protein